MPYQNNFLPPTENRHVAVISKFGMIEYLQKYLNNIVIDQNLMKISVDQFILRILTCGNLHKNFNRGLEFKFEKDC